MRWVVGIVVVVAAVAGILWWVDSTTPNSTQGVSLTADYEARLPVGETLVLVHTVGKARSTYEITYDGEVVRFHCPDWFCSDLEPAALNNNGSTADVDVSWLGEPLHVSRRPDGAASVRWPGGFLSGWEYRKYRP